MRKQRAEMFSVLFTLHSALSTLHFHLSTFHLLHNYTITQLQNYTDYSLYTPVIV